MLQITNFKYFKTNIYKISLLLKNNQLILFNDINYYTYQYILESEFHITFNDIIDKKDFKFNNINLYIITINNSNNINKLYKWYHIYNFIEYI